VEGRSEKRGLKGGSLRECLNLESSGVEETNFVKRFTLGGFRRERAWETAREELGEEINILGYPLQNRKEGNS